MVYILKRDHETIEVLEGREDKRDRLIQAGYTLVELGSVNRMRVGEPGPEIVTLPPGAHLIGGEPVDITGVLNGEEPEPPMKPLRHPRGDE